MESCPNSSTTVGLQQPVVCERQPSCRALSLLLFSAAVLIGGLHTWAGRFYMNPDGICYLDLAEAWMRGDWAAAVNAHWSPLYPWILGVALFLSKPSAYWEFPVVHAVGFAVYVATLGCFRFLMSELLRLNQRRDATLRADDRAGLPDWVWLTLGHALFIWCSLPLMIASPDMCVAAFTYLACAILLRIRNGSTKYLTFASLGLVLGLGYLAKSPMFPLAFVFLGCGLFLPGDIRRAFPRVLLAVGVFALVAAPLVVALSIAKGRLTFGDSGRLNYAWKVNGVTEYTHWQGGPPGCGTPLHPTRKLLDSPGIYEFAKPIAGTYPAWYDPSYWYEGVTPHFDLKEQLRVLKEGAEVYFHLFYHWQGGLIVGVLALYLLGFRRSSALRPLMQYAFIFVPAIVALAMYWGVFVSLRYVSPFMLVLFLALMGGVTLPCRRELDRAVSAVCTAMLVLMGIGIAACLIRPVDAGSAERRLIGASHVQGHIADRLTRMGVKPGSAIALAGSAMEAYWARLARVRIVAEIPASLGDADQFRMAYPYVKDRVFDTLRTTEAEVLIAERLPPAYAAQGWEPMDDRGRLWLFRLRREPK